MKPTVYTWFGEVETIILRYLVNEDGPRRGRDILKIVKARNPRPYKTNISACVSTWDSLQNLTKRGILSKSPLPGRRKKGWLYELTPLGRMLMVVRTSQNIKRGIELVCST